MSGEYYNTTNLKGSELKEAKSQVKGQTEKIYEFFLSRPGREFTPAEVHTRLFGYNCPITSVRRAMTNLTKDEKLMKTKIKRYGDYGKVNYCWMLNQTQLNMFMR